MLISLTFAHVDGCAESGSDDESKAQRLTKGSQDPISPTSSAFLSRNNFSFGFGLTTARSVDFNQSNKANS
jgi:hypothetical protein